jgi:hypothetical protein
MYGYGIDIYFVYVLIGKTDRWLQRYSRKLFAGAAERNPQMKSISQYYPL